MNRHSGALTASFFVCGLLSSCGGSTQDQDLGLSRFSSPSEAALASRRAHAAEQEKAIDSHQTALRSFRDAAGTSSSFHLPITTSTSGELRLLSTNLATGLAIPSSTVRMLAEDVMRTFVSVGHNSKETVELVLWGELDSQFVLDLHLPGHQSDLVEGSRLTMSSLEGVVEASLAHFEILPGSSFNIVGLDQEGCIRRHEHFAHLSGDVQPMRLRTIETVPVQLFE